MYVMSNGKDNADCKGSKPAFVVSFEAIVMKFVGKTRPIALSHVHATL